jgi:hypothetical protein
MVSATANVQLTLEVRGLGTWRDDCSVADIQRLAVKEAIDVLQRLMNPTPGVKPPRPDVRIIDDPKVTVVLVEREP